MPINGNGATLAYSDSVYYYGQYTEAGSGSFLGATVVFLYLAFITVSCAFVI